LEKPSTRRRPSSCRNSLKKMYHIKLLYCNVRVLLWHVLFHTSHTTLFGKHFMSYVRQ
jgi:hypothetical protein